MIIKDELVVHLDDTLITFINRSLVKSFIFFEWLS